MEKRNVNTRKDMTSFDPVDYFFKQADEEDAYGQFYSDMYNREYLK